MDKTEWGKLVPRTKISRLNPSSLPGGEQPSGSVIETGGEVNDTPAVFPTEEEVRFDEAVSHNEPHPSKRRKIGNTGPSIPPQPPVNVSVKKREKNQRKKGKRKTPHKSASGISGGRSKGAKDKNPRTRRWSRKPRLGDILAAMEFQRNFVVGQGDFSSDSVCDQACDSHEKNSVGDDTVSSASEIDGASFFGSETEVGSNNFHTFNPSALLSVPAALKSSD